VPTGSPFSAWSEKKKLESSISHEISLLFKGAVRQSPRCKTIENNQGVIWGADRDRDFSTVDQRLLIGCNYTLIAIGFNLFFGRLNVFIFPTGMCASWGLSSS